MKGCLTVLFWIVVFLIFFTLAMVLLIQESVEGSDGGVLQSILVLTTDNERRGTGG